MILRALKWKLMKCMLQNNLVGTNATAILQTNIALWQSINSTGWVKILEEVAFPAMAEGG